MLCASGYRLSSRRRKNVERFTHAFTAVGTTRGEGIIRVVVYVVVATLF